MPGALGTRSAVMNPPLCDIPLGAVSLRGPWTVTRSSLRMLHRVAVFLVVWLPR